MVGSALVRLLKKKNVHLVLKNKNQLNLTNQSDVKNFFNKQKIDQVYIAAAKVGGIYANNKFPSEFIYENTMIQTNIINSAFESGVKKILFLGSSCIYPKITKQPIKEEQLLTGLIEPTNEPYAIAKISGIKICESYNRQYGDSHNIDYRSIIPTNLYGINDNYYSLNTHVIPALIQRFHQAKIKNESKIKIWGLGKARREFLYVDDLAKACILVMNLNPKVFYKVASPMCSHINVGSGVDITIKDLAILLKKITNYSGQIEFDDSKPEGTLLKKLNSQRMLSFGWKPKVSLKKGLTKTYQDYKKLLKTP